MKKPTWTGQGLFENQAMASHSSTLAWRIPWTEEPGGLQPIRSLRVRHDWATSLSLACIGEGNGNSLRCSYLQKPRDGETWWAAVYGVTQSQTGLKRLSSSSSLISVMFKKLSRIFFSTNNDNFVSFLLILCIYLSCLIDWAGFPVLLWMVLVIVETWTYSFFFF